MISTTYFDFEELIATKEPSHQRRLDLITQGLSGKVSLEPMTIIFKEYLGAGHISYKFPFEGDRMLKNSSADGFLHSNWKGKKSWFFMAPAFRALNQIKERTAIMHFLCARTTPLETNVKDLYPLLMVAARSTGAQKFSAEAHNAFLQGIPEYLEWCAEQNTKWIESYIDSQPDRCQQNHP